MSVTVSEGAGGTQHVHITCDKPGRLLLHWGVEGGASSKTGWRLPSAASRPEGTAEYKKRALQTPFVPGSNGTSGTQQLTVTLSGGDTADYLDFVLKDIETGQWYDLNGSNYQIPLTASVEEGSAADVNVTSSADEPASATGTSQKLLPLDQIPSLPQDLSGVWSYMKWEAAGCPNRSAEESDREYQAALDELTLLLRQGITLDTLRDISGEGVQRYMNFIAKQEKEWAVPQSRKEAQQGQQAAAPVENIPEELINIKAFLLWEQAGKPDGADFGSQAREALVADLTAGKSLQDIERTLKGPAEPAHEQTVEAAAAPPPPPAPAAEPAPVQEAYVGDGIGLRGRNPLDLVRRRSGSAPRLAEQQGQKEEPLGPLKQAAAEDDSCVWNRVRVPRLMRCATLHGGIIPCRYFLKCFMSNN